MVQNRKVTGTAAAMPAGIATGALCSAAVTMFGAAAAAWMIHKEMIPENAVGYGSLVILLLSSGIGAGVAVSRIKHRRMYVCLLSALVYYLLLLSITALFFGGQYTGMGVTALAVLGGSVGAGLIGLNKGTKPKRFKYTSR